MISLEYNLELVDRMGKRHDTVEPPKAEITLYELEELLGLRDEDVGMVIVNGAWAPLACTIPDGASVKLYPDTEGG